MKLYITKEPHNGIWGEDAIVSFDRDCGYVHVTFKQTEPIVYQMAARKLINFGITKIELAGDGWNTENRFAFYQGFTTANGKSELIFEQEDKTYDNLVEVIDWVKNVINLPSNEIYPESLVSSSCDFLTSIDNSIKCNVISDLDLLNHNYVGTYTVGKGSDKKPYILIADYNPVNTSEVDVALVGKGITFDSGGYSLKPNDYMVPMKSDMGGAATVIGALGLLAKNKVQCHAKAIICCAENLVSGFSFKLGDIINYPNNVSVEVMNTDAEGRLVLADGLIEAQKYNPKLIIDAATLTGAAKVALGRDYNAALSFDEQLSEWFKKCASRVNEKVWTLPLEKFHKNQVKGTVADITNSAGIEGSAGASTAAAFLSYFVKENQQWLHIDLSASFQKNPNELFNHGAKGHGIRTIVEFICEFLQK